MKNLIILLIFLASFSSLGVNLNWNPNCLNLGPLNNNSKFGLIAVPVTLEIYASGFTLIPPSFNTDAAAFTVKNCFNLVLIAPPSVVIFLTKFSRFPSVPPNLPLETSPTNPTPAPINAAEIDDKLSSPHAVWFASDNSLGIGNVTIPRVLTFELSLELKSNSLFPNVPVNAPATSPTTYSI